MVKKATGNIRRFAALLAVAAACFSVIAPVSAEAQPINSGATSGTLFGTIDFEDIAPDAPMQNVTFYITPTDHSIAFTQTLRVGSDGRFTLTGVPQGAYYLRAKADRYLATTQLIINSAHNAEMFLRAGDANNDNWVDVFDLDVIIRCFDAVQGVDPHYDENADSNGDGIVDMTDLVLFIRNFDAEGDW